VTGGGPDAFVEAMPKMPDPTGSPLRSGLPVGSAGEAQQLRHSDVLPPPSPPGARARPAPLRDVPRVTQIPCHDPRASLRLVVVRSGTDVAGPTDTREGGRTMNTTAAQPHEVLVLGAGYAGLSAAIQLAARTRKRENLRVTLVNPYDLGGSRRSASDRAGDRARWARSRRERIDSRATLPRGPGQRTAYRAPRLDGCLIGWTEESEEGGRAVVLLPVRAALTRTGLSPTEVRSY